MDENLELLSHEGLAKLADELLKELDRLEEIERNIKIEPEEYIVTVKGCTFAFSSHEAMCEFIYRATR